MANIINASTVNNGLVYSADASGILELRADSNIITLENVNGSLIIPKGTTAQRPNNPINGAVRFNTTTNTFEIYKSGAWADGIAGNSTLLQVKSTTLTTPFTTTVLINNGGAAITGLSVDITPTYVTSKFLVFGHVNGSGATTVTQFYMKLKRNAIDIGNGTPSGNLTGIIGRHYDQFLSVSGNDSFTFLDQPSTSNQLTYQIYVGAAVSGTVYVNRTENDNNASNGDGFRGSSTIVVMEIA